MNLVEIRLLDGPNIFLDQPAVKIELELMPDDQPSEVKANMDQAVNLLQQELGETISEDSNLTRWQALETPDHFAIVFPWARREYSICIATVISNHLARQSADGLAMNLADCRATLEHTDPATDSPDLIAVDGLGKKIVAITGTNGKTTTTRLISHIFMCAGQTVGWSSSSGVYVNGEEKLAGDYSGPQGAATVINDPSVDIAVVESARGGILLRGLAFDQADVTVFTNISADHLDLQGIHTVEALAKVKAVVCRATRPDGVAVLNADDSLVMSACADVNAQHWLISRQPKSPVVTSHLENGGTAVVAEGNEIVLIQSGSRRIIADLLEIPMTFHGHAGFMIENALLGSAASLAAGASVDLVHEGLLSFENSPDLNSGRMNVFQLNGVVVVIDFAHNEAGLVGLIEFAKSINSSGKIIAVIGTAGDRNESAIKALGSIAATESDRVISKGTYKYLRGRELDDLMRLYREGVEESGVDTPFEETPDEIGGLLRGLELADSGDVVIVMAQEFISELHTILKERGATPYLG
jgi:cyanophycin synthetase